LDARSDGFIIQGDSLFDLAILAMQLRESAVAPSEAQQLCVHHHRLEDSIKAVDRLLSADCRSALWLAQLQQQVRALQDDQGSIFDILDQDGYLREVDDHAPHLHDRLKRLYQEQLTLVRAVEQIQRELAAVEPAAVDPLCQRLRNLLLRIQAHEHCKNLLVMDAFNVDQAALD
jgi:hypothetical protein